MTDAIFVNGTLLTQDVTNPRAEALAVERGRISAIGARDDIENLTRPGTRQTWFCPRSRRRVCGLLFL